MERTLIGMLLVLLLSSAAFAAIGPTAYTKQPYTTLFLLDKDVPVSLSSANIVFDFSGPPAENDVDRINLGGEVTSTYRVENTSDAEQTALMAFAFYDTIGTLEEEISVQVDGEEVAYVPYMGSIQDSSSRMTAALGIIKTPDTEEDSLYDYSSIEEMIRNGGVYTPKAYSLDDEGILYTFDVESLIDVINFYVGLDFDPNKTKVITDNSFNSWEYGPGSIKCGMNINKDNIDPGRYCSFFVLGEQREFRVTADDGYPDPEETDAFTYKVTQKKYSFEEYLDEMYNLNTRSDIGRARLLQCMDEVFTEGDGIATDGGIDKNYSYERALAAGFTVVLPPNSSREIKIQHDSYTSMNRQYTADQYSPVFTEKILFNPPNNWQSTGGLDITVLTSGKAPFIVKSNYEFEKNEDKTFRTSFDTLPAGSLTFSMHAEEYVRTKGQFWIIGLIIIAAIVLVVIFRKRLVEYFKSLKYR